MMSNHSNRASFLEDSIANDIDNNRLIPYIQLHEFEALLFSSVDGFSKLQVNSKQLKQIEKIINKFRNPEEINDKPDSAPSKRLIKIIPS